MIASIHYLLNKEQHKQKRFHETVPPRKGFVKTILFLFRNWIQAQIHSGIGEDRKVFLYVKSFKSLFDNVVQKNDIRN